MKIEIGTTRKTIGCHHWRVTNSSGRPTAARHASTAPGSPCSPRVHRLSGAELRYAFFAPARSATSTHPHANAAITCSWVVEIRWYSEKIPTVASAIVSAEANSKPRYAK